MKRVIEPLLEKDFLPTRCGFRPGRGGKDALREVDRLLRDGYTPGVDADLKGDVDSIPHARWMARVEEPISDGHLLERLAGGLPQDVVKGLERWTPTGGPPPGAVMSPGLSNIDLHPLDARRASQGFQRVRQADDLVILCPMRTPQDRH